MMTLPSKAWDSYSERLFRDLVQCEICQDWEEVENITEELMEHFFTTKGESNE